MKSAEYWWSSGMTEEHRNLSPIMWINAIQQDARAAGVREGLCRAMEVAAKMSPFVEEEIELLIKGNDNDG